MKALGRLCLVRPVKEESEVFYFEIKKKILHGELISKGDDCPEELKEGDTVFFRNGGHRVIGDQLILSHLSILGYAK